MATDGVGESQDNQEAISQLYEAYKEQAGSSAVSQDEFTQEVAAAFPNQDDASYNTSLFGDGGFGDKLGKALFGDDYSFSSDSGDTFTSTLSAIAGNDENPDDVTLDDFGITQEDLDNLKGSTDASSTSTLTTGDVNLDKYVIEAAAARNSGQYESANAAIAKALAEAVNMQESDIHVSSDGTVDATETGSGTGTDSETEEDMQNSSQQKEYTPEFKSLVQQTIDANKDKIQTFYSYGKGSGNMPDGVSIDSETFAEDLGKALVENNGGNLDDPNAVTDALLSLMTDMAYDGLSTDDNIIATYDSAKVPMPQNTEETVEESVPAPELPEVEQEDVDTLFQASLPNVDENGFNYDAFAAKIDEMADMTPEEVVAMLTEFTNDYGSFVNAMDEANISQEQISMIAGKLNEAAQSTNPEVANAATGLICNELKNATDGWNKLGTAEEFVYAIIENADISVLESVMEYANANGIDLQSYISDDFSDNEASYINSKLTAAAPEAALDAAVSDEPVAEPAPPQKAFAAEIEAAKQEGVEATAQTTADAVKSIMSDNTLTSEQKTEKLTELVADAIDSGDYDAIKDMLTDESIDNAQWTDIVAKYNSTHEADKYPNESFFNQINSSILTEEQSNAVMATVAQKLGNAANDGNTNAISVISNELYNAMQGDGTVETTVTSLLENCSDSVIVDIVNQYSSSIKTDGLIHDIRSDFTNPIESKLVNRINDALISEAKNGNSKATDAICTTLYNSINGSSLDGKTVKYILENCDSQLIADIVKQYNNVDGSGSRILLADIQNRFPQQAQNSIIDTVRNALSEVYGPPVKPLSTPQQANQPQKLAQTQPIDLSVPEGLYNLLGISQVSSNEALVDSIHTALTSGDFIKTTLIQEFFNQNPQLKESIQSYYMSRYPGDKNLNF